MTPEAELARLAICRTFAATGRAPSQGAIAQAAKVAESEVDGMLRELAANRHIALGDGMRIEMAHPFSSINLGFSVMGENTLWWGGCAWDSFAIPHLVPGEPSVLVATTCPACHSAHAWTVTQKEPPAGSQMAHFLVPVHDIWPNVVHACANQRIFCNESCIATWLQATGHAEGSVFDLETLWRLAKDWYKGRLDTPYTRREPVEAAAYFTGVGLTGRFWGLDT